MTESRLTKKQLNDICQLLIPALKFYADPDTYFAVGFFPDRPCGEIMDDFSETHLDLKPGKRAREAFAAARQMLGLADDGSLIAAHPPTEIIALPRGD